MTEVLQQDLAERIHCELPRLDEYEVCELARVIERLAEAFQPERIYVFGSQARGEATPNSDIDLLIVVAQSNEPAHRLAQAAAPVRPLPAGRSFLAQPGRSGSR